MTKRNRMIAILFIMMLLFVRLFSAVFIIAESNHECTGEDCRVCYQISVCQNVLKTLSSAVVAVSIGAALTYILVCLIFTAIRTYTHTTLITLKVKLSD